MRLYKGAHPANRPADHFTASRRSLPNGPRAHNSEAPMSSSRPTPILLAFVLLAIQACQVHAQSAPTDLNATGVKPFGSVAGNDIEYVDLNNGGVNVRIPFLTKKGRGLDFNLNIAYSSKFW